MIRLVRTFDRNTEILSLISRKLRQLHAKLVEMQTRDLLIEMLRQRVNLALVLRVVCVQLDLRHHLVGEAR